MYALCNNSNCFESISFSHLKTKKFERKQFFHRQHWINTFALADCCHGNWLLRIGVWIKSVRSFFQQLVNSPGRIGHRSCKKQLWNNSSFLAPGQKITLCPTQMRIPRLGCDTICSLFPGTEWRLSTLHPNPPTGPAAKQELARNNSQKRVFTLQRGGWIFYHFLIVASGARSFN